ncbi:hypothetical protein DPMN_007004 [Dreissena polymorpha]|uniref:Uncharacterized protein n=1 Tax=Dreissena polymorpha TaxID=45954 RepID=A0A9D4MV31_DREPO|nr:hypothetical protein DPMN_007004 [Dreissena polymorpha]
MLNVYATEDRAVEVEQDVSPLHRNCRGAVDIRAVPDVQEIDGRILAVGLAKLAP